MSIAVYRLAQDNEMALLLALSRPTAPIGWPNVVAMRDKELLGFILTQDRDEAVIAGPLWLSDGLKQKAFVAMRLFEAYERIMALAGMQSFMFYIDHESDHFIKLLKNLPGFAILSEDDERVWFKRRIRWVAAAT